MALCPLVDSSALLYPEGVKSPIDAYRDTESGLWDKSKQVCVLELYTGILTKLYTLVLIQFTFLINGNRFVQSTAEGQTLPVTCTVVKK